MYIRLNKQLNMVPNIKLLKLLLGIVRGRKHFLDSV